MARGSITPRPNKDGKRVHYRVQWESRWPDGRWRYHSKTLPNKKAAEAFLTGKLAEVDAGTFVVASQETFGEFLERWLAANEDWAESTLSQYRSVVRVRLVPYLGSVPLARLDELTTQSCYARLSAAGYSRQSVKSAHSVLDSALGQAVAWRLLPRNPADGVKAPTPVVAAPATWTAEEAASFLAATEADRWSALWRLGLDSGMRLGEMLALQWRDVDLDNGVVSVRRTLTLTKENAWTIGELAKTESSRRTIDLGGETVTALRKQFVRQAERRLAAAVWHDLGLVFDRGNGNWVDPSVVRRAFERGVARAGVPELTPHGMRHTMATLMLAAGVHPKVVQERLGHRSIQMTLDRYSHVTRSMQKDAAAVLETVLGKGARPARWLRGETPHDGEGARRPLQMYQV